MTARSMFKGKKILYSENMKRWQYYGNNKPIRK